MLIWIIFVLLALASFCRAGKLIAETDGTCGWDVFTTLAAVLVHAGAICYLGYWIYIHYNLPV